MTEIHVITGGGGYPGFCLGKKLAESGKLVRLLDIREPAWDLTNNMQFIQGSVCDFDFVNTAVQQASVVYHMASYGMSGREQLDRDLIEKVNIGGTENILKACLRNNVSRLVYTSTYNVVFGGQETRNGDEHLPYLSDDMFTDHYSKTKMIAEKRVLSFNGTETDDNTPFHCCALRLAGVYGPGEQRHIPRIVSYLERGLVVVTYGEKESLVDFLHVDNLVQAHQLAADALSPQKKFVAAGRAYFISDNKPVNNFEFFRPLFEGLGYSYPRINLPVTLVFYIAWCIEILHYILRRIYNFQPLLTRSEVYKTGVTHYFSISRAAQDIGYKPTIQNDLSEVVNRYRILGRTKQNYSSNFVYYSVNVLIIFLIYTFFMIILPTVT